MNKKIIAGTVATCCNKNKETRTVFWKEADFSDGPEQTGWCFIVGRTGDCWENARFCPFCGVELFLLEESDD